MTAAVVLGSIMTAFFLGAILGSMTAMYRDADRPVRLHCDECNHDFNCSRSLGLHWAAEHMGPPKLRVVRASDPPEAA